MLPSPPSDVFVLGLPYVRCLFFQRSSSRCVGFASGVPTAFAFELSKTVAFPRLLCTSEVPPNGPNPREVSLPWLSPWTFACAHPPDAWRLSLVFVSVLCVCGGFVLQCAPRPACQRLLGRGATSSLLLLTSFYSFLRGGAVVVDSGNQKEATEGRAAPAVRGTNCATQPRRDRCRSSHAPCGRTAQCIRMHTYNFRLTTFASPSQLSRQACV